MSEITRGSGGREVVRVGVDLAKRVIQVHAVDGACRVVTSRALARDKFMPWCTQLPAGCLVVMEVSSSAHHWGRKLKALGMDARIVAAQLAAPYRIEGATGKNDANDAEPGHEQSLRTVRAWRRAGPLRPARGRDLRGRQPPAHALRAHQNRGATKHAGRAQSP